MNAETCLYVSSEEIWAFSTDDYAENHADNECHKLGLHLAVIENEDENTALHELTSMLRYL